MIICKSNVWEGKDRREPEWTSHSTGENVKDIDLDGAWWPGLCLLGLILLSLHTHFLLCLHLGWGWEWGDQFRRWRGTNSALLTIKGLSLWSDRPRHLMAPQEPSALLTMPSGKCSSWVKDFPELFAPDPPSGPPVRLSTSARSVFLFSSFRPRPLLTLLSLGASCPFGFSCQLSLLSHQPHNKQSQPLIEHLLCAHRWTRHYF